jgi:hypothetical protein
MFLEVVTGTGWSGEGEAVGDNIRSKRLIPVAVLSSVKQGRLIYHDVV